MYIHILSPSHEGTSTSHAWDHRNPRQQMMNNMMMGGGGCDMHPGFQKGLKPPSPIALKLSWTAPSPHSVLYYMVLCYIALNYITCSYLEIHNLWSRATPRC